MIFPIDHIKAPYTLISFCRSTWSVRTIHTRLHTREKERGQQLHAVGLSSKRPPFLLPPGCLSFTFAPASTITHRAHTQRQDTLTTAAVATPARRTPITHHHHHHQHHQHQHYQKQQHHHHHQHHNYPQQKNNNTATTTTQTVCYLVFCGAGQPRGHD